MKLSPNMVNQLTRLRVRADTANEYPRDITPCVEIGLGGFDARTARSLARRGLVDLGRRGQFDTVTINDAGRKALEAA